MRALLLFLLFLTSVMGSGFFQSHNHGWHWYEPLPQDEEETPKEDHEKKHKTPTELIKAYRADLEHLMAKAWLNPTGANIKAYQEKQKDLFDRSTRFSNQWMKTVFTHPHLDHTLITPVDHKARHIYLDQQKEETKQTIQHLSKTYGLFFFFSSSCSYCSAFAPIVKRFSETYGWEVLPITVDGKTIADFPQAVPDNGLSVQWKVSVLPSLFAVNPSTGHVLPIAFGMTSLDEMEARIMTLVKEEK